MNLPFFVSDVWAVEPDSTYRRENIEVGMDSSIVNSALSSRLAVTIDSLGMGACADSNRVDTVFQAPQEINNPVWDVAPPPRKRPWLSGIEVVGTNALFHIITRYIIHEDYAQITWSSIKNNFKTGFLWDNDKFNTNLFFHPYQGGLYFNCARSNGLNFWQSAPYALFGSSIWELFLELQPPSTNDIISTTLGGMALGEVSYRLSSLVLNGQARGWNRFAHEAVGLILNPVRGVNRLMTGEAWRVGPRYVDRMATVPFYFQFDAGYRVLNCFDSQPNRSRHIGFIGFNMVYNDPFEIEGNEPFEHFTARMLLNLFSRQPAIGEASICASIWGRAHDYANGNELFAGIFQNYNYYDSESFSDESSYTPFRIAETVSYGPGLLYRARFQGNNSLSLNGFLSGIVLGGSLSDYFQFHDRDYNMGSGYSVRVNGLFSLRQKLGLYLAFENYHIFTWKGYEQKDYEHIDQNYLNAQGDVGNARLQRLNFRASFAIAPQLSIAAETVWYRRKTHYKYFPDVRSDTFEFRLMFSYHI